MGLSAISIELVVVVVDQLDVVVDQLDVVGDQLVVQYVKQNISSIVFRTKNFTLWV